LRSPPWPQRASALILGESSRKLDIPSGSGRLIASSLRDSIRSFSRVGEERLMNRCRLVASQGIGFGLFSMLLLCPIVRADVFNMGPGLTKLEFVTVGNPGNGADYRYNGIVVGSV